MCVSVVTYIYIKITSITKRTREEWRGLGGLGSFALNKRYDTSVYSTGHRGPFSQHRRRRDDAAVVMIEINGIV